MWICVLFIVECVFVVSLGWEDGANDCGKIWYRDSSGAFTAEGR